MMGHLRFDIGAAAAIVVVVVLTAAATFVPAWLLNSRTAESMAQQAFADRTARTEERIDALIGSTLRLVNTSVILPEFSTPPTAGDPEWPGLAYLRAVLAENPDLYSAYVGYRDGSFVQVIPVRGVADIILAHAAPPDTDEILRSIVSESGGQRTQQWTFLDRERRVLATRTEADVSYDPSSRPWYAAADAKAAMISTPYVFNSLKRPGITVSRRLPAGNGVFGADMTLDGLSRFVEAAGVSANGAVILTDAEGRLLAAPSSVRGSLPALIPISETHHPSLIMAAAMVGSAGPASSFIQKEHDYLASSSRYKTGNIVVTVVAPVDDFTGHIRHMSVWIVVLTGAVLVAVVPIGYWIARFLSTRLRELSDDAERVTQMDFSGTVRDSAIIEFSNLARAFKAMKTMVLSRTRDIEDSNSKLNRILNIGIAMANQEDIGHLVEMIVLEAEKISGAEGGTLFLLTEDGRNLHIEFIHNKTLNISIGGSAGLDFELPSTPHLDPQSGQPLLDNVVCAAIHHGRSIDVPDVRACDTFDFSSVREFDERTGYLSKSVLVVPLRPRGGAVIGAIQLINARKPGVGEPIAFSPGIRRYVEALAALAANALHNRSLLDAQEKLIDSIVKVIAVAVDAKSPHTAGHSERVGELASMLAEEASRIPDGPLAQFRFETPAQWREFHIAAWLHDCGKVTTPEFVVDKATKLETIHNRIHEIRTRFEVLLRDAEVERLTSIIAGTTPATAQDRYDRARRELMDDFAFVAECNIGGEFMGNDKIDRLKKVASRTWLRHFDDRLGLSHEELRRLDGIAARALPVEESLLCDRPEHVIPWTGLEKFNSGEWGFSTRIPVAMYNRGELHNLSIVRGTLTEEERFKISEHVIQTVIMLESLPLPKHLKRVPEYAGAHHEALNGTGYPRSLRDDELSIPSRIMAIADIFEALTASDRPYKKAKTLSEAVGILAGFRDRGHIDPLLFELFLTSGIFRRYGTSFLKPDQIDDVDVSRYLATAP